jgi:hypothetical protein
MKPTFRLGRRSDVVQWQKPRQGWTRDEQIQQLMGDRTYSYDANACLSDGAAAQTASGYAQCTGVDGIVDLGGNQLVTITLPSIADSSTITPQQARIDAVCVIDVTAIDIASGNETYRLCVVGSNDPAFGSGKVNCLGEMEIGKGASLGFANGQDAPAVPAIGGNRYEVPFTNEQANVKYQFVKLYLVISGTTPSITFKAWVAVLPEP